MTWFKIQLLFGGHGCEKNISPLSQAFMNNVRWKRVVLRLNFQNILWFDTIKWSWNSERYDFLSKNGQKRHFFADKFFCFPAINDLDSHEYSISISKVVLFWYNTPVGRNPNNLMRHPGNTYRPRSLTKLTKIEITKIRPKKIDYLFSVRVPKPKC